MTRTLKAIVIASFISVLLAPAVFGCVCDPRWAVSTQFQPTLTVQSTGLTTARVTANGYAIAGIHAESSGNAALRPVTRCAVSVSWAGAPITQINSFTLHDSLSAQPLYEFSSNDSLNGAFVELAQENDSPNTEWLSFSQEHFDLPEDHPVYFVIDVELQQGKTAADLNNALRAGPCQIATTAFDDFGNRVKGHETIASTSESDLLPSGPTCAKVVSKPFDPFVIEDEF